MFNFTIDKKEKELNLLDFYDLIVIGAGPGGTNAALYAKRRGLNVLMIASFSNSQVLDTKLIENYLGYTSITGEDLNNAFIEHAKSVDVDFLNGSTVVEVSKNDDLFSVTLDDQKIIKSHSVILATGARPRKLNAKGEKELTGRGVSYCAICDGPFYRNKKVVVVGGGNSALETAIDMAKIAESVFIIQLEDNFTGDKVLVDQIEKLENISYTLSSSTNEFIGSELLEKIKYTNNKTKKEHIVEAEGVFIEIGVIPNNSLVKDLVETNRFGEVITDKHQKTSVEGLYAVGDLTDFPYKQIITAASQGAVAALSANEYINRKDKNNG